MKKFNELAEATSKIQARPVDKNQVRPLRSAPTQLYDAAARMHEAEAKVEELEALLVRAESDSVVKDLRIKDLVFVEGRKRNLSETEYIELKENLRTNDLVTPITVRKLPNGAYEVVSGYNRCQAFLDLGREIIPSFISLADEARAEINAFYANLLQPNLPDFEKFLGFKLIQDRNPHLTQQQIADNAGISPTTLSRLLAFGNLPPMVLERLTANPRIIGLNAASILASIASPENEARMAEALIHIEKGEMDQGFAKDFVLGAPLPAKAASIIAATKTTAAGTSKPPAAIVTPYKVGKKSLCSYRVTDKSLRVDFKDAIHAAEVSKEIAVVLEKYAERIKNQNS